MTDFNVTSQPQSRSESRPVHTPGITQETVPHDGANAYLFYLLLLFFITDLVHAHTVVKHVYAIHCVAANQPKLASVS